MEKNMKKGQMKNEPLTPSLRAYNPMVANHFEKYFQHIVNKHNSIYKVQLPRITPHVLRHTFCSRMAEVKAKPLPHFSLHLFAKL